jgi:hypothetical protein
MTKLKIEDRRWKPVNVSVELPASTHRDVFAYAEAVDKLSGRPISDM